METVDLKERQDFVEQYVELRNKYIDVLLTPPVTVMGTREWLKRDDIDIRGIVENKILSGAVILYKGRGGEVAFFVRAQNRGMGTELLRIIEQAAIQSRLPSLWSWVREENVIAQRAFEKNGFTKEGIVLRDFLNVRYQGFQYRKDLLCKGNR